MRIHLVTGGARSGKSSHAERLARELGGERVTFVATARATDDEMERRIARHRAARPAGWVTVEAPDTAALAVAAAGTDVVLLDCLTTLLASVAIGPGDEDAVVSAMLERAELLVAGAAARRGDLIIVTNEVGDGLHPETPLGRWYRDGLGLANQRVAAAAHTVTLMVCGVPVPVKPRV